MALVGALNLRPRAIIFAPTSKRSHWSSRWRLRVCSPRYAKRSANRDRAAAEGAPESGPRRSPVALAVAGNAEVRRPRSGRCSVRPIQDSGSPAYRIHSSLGVEQSRIRGLRGCLVRGMCGNAKRTDAVMLRAIDRLTDAVRDCLINSRRSTTWGPSFPETSNVSSRAANAPGRWIVSSRKGSRILKGASGFP
jgi:hypothetical protein